MKPIALLETELVNIHKNIVACEYVINRYKDNPVYDGMREMAAEKLQEQKELIPDYEIAIKLLNI